MKLRPTENKCQVRKRYLQQLQNPTPILSHYYLDEQKTMVSKERLLASGVRLLGSELVYGLISLISGELLQVQCIYKEPKTNTFVKLIRGSANGEPVYQALTETKLADAIKIVLAESLTKACAIADAIDHEDAYSVLNCVNSGNMVKVAENLASMPYFKGKVIIAADNDLDKYGKAKSGNVTDDGYSIPVLDCAIKYNIPIVKPKKGFKDYDDWLGANAFGASEIWECIKNAVPYEGIIKKNTKQSGNLFKSVKNLYGDLRDQFSRMANKFGLVEGSGHWDQEYEWLIESWIPFNAIGFLGGPSASGKSFVVIEIMGAIAFGLKAFNSLQVPKDKQGAVLYCAIEGLQGVSHRFEGWRASREIEKELWNKKVFQFHKPFSFKNTAPKEFVKSIKLIEKGSGEKLRLVVIDTFINYAGIASENSSTDVQNAIQWMREVSQLGKLSVMAIHHTGKNETPIGCDFNTLLRGSSDFGASAEFVLGVAQAIDDTSGETIPYVWSAKLKDADKFPPLSAKIDTHELQLSSGIIQEIGVISLDQKIAYPVKPKAKKQYEIDGEFLLSEISKNDGKLDGQTLSSIFKKKILAKQPDSSTGSIRKRFVRAIEYVYSTSSIESHDGYYSLPSKPEKLKVCDVIANGDIKLQADELKKDSEPELCNDSPTQQADSLKMLELLSASDTGINFHDLKASFIEQHVATLSEGAANRRYKHTLERLISSQNIEESGDIVKLIVN